MGSGILLLFLFGWQGFALDGADVMPGQVLNPSLRTGQIGGLGEKYDASGRLIRVGDAYSQSFNANKIEQHYPEFQKLRQILNQFPYQLGDQVHLGTLQVQADPEVKYMGFLMAYGVTDRFTVAAGIPVVDYKVHVGLSETGTNVSAIKAQFRGISPELDGNLGKLDEMSLAQRTQGFLSERGYKPLQNQEKRFIGDAQIVAIYKIVDHEPFATVVRTTAILPTGPEDDPSDLLDPTDFHQPALGALVQQDVKLLSRWTLGVLGGYTWKIPDTARKRVPMDENDTLPDASREETLQRDVGDIVHGEANVRYLFTDFLEAGTAYEIGHQGADTYSGGRGYNYELLGRRTDSVWQKMRLGLEFSTVKWYLKKSFSMPFLVTYHFVDTFAGRNIEKQSVHELELKFFF